MEVADINLLIKDIVSKALTKAEKVVIITIINRTDVRDIDLKVVCDNHKLYDDHFRIRDRLHLTDDGVSLFASNLKYAIAKRSWRSCRAETWTPEGQDILSGNNHGSPEIGSIG